MAIVTDPFAHYDRQAIVSRFETKNPKIKEQEEELAAKLALFICNDRSNPLLMTQKKSIFERAESKYRITIRNVDQFEKVLFGKLYSLCLKLGNEFSELQSTDNAEESRPKRSKGKCNYKALGGVNSAIVKHKDSSTQEEIKYLLLDNLEEGEHNSVRNAVDVAKCRFVVLRSLKNPTKERAVVWIKELKLQIDLQEIIQGVVKVHHIFFNPYMASLEKMDMDLFSLLRKRRALSIENVIEIMSQILKINLDFHGIKQMHGDLKLENILVSEMRNDKGTSSFDVKFCDFGFTRQLSSGYQLTGTFGYLPIEAFYLTKEIVDIKKIDSFSMGIILYELITGPQNILTPLTNKIMDLYSMFLGCEKIEQPGAFIRFSEKEYPDIKYEGSIEKHFDMIIKTHFESQLKAIWATMKDSLRNHPFGKLINGLLEIDPSKRLSIEEAMKEMDSFKKNKLLKALFSKEGYIFHFSLIQLLILISLFKF